MSSAGLENKNARWQDIRAQLTDALALLRQARERRNQEDERFYAEMVRSLVDKESQAYQDVRLAMSAGAADVIQKE